MRGLDVERVGAWLVDHVEGATAPFEFELIAGGRSNLTFAVTDGAGHRYVVRRPPLGHVLATAHDMAREHRLIAAVGTTSVPVPRALGLCTDEEVNGAPFYVMAFVDGVVLDAPEKARALPPDVCRAAGFDLVDVLAALHDVDVDDVGLGDLAKREAYIERQLRRWSRQWQDSKTREVPLIEEVERRLRTDIPPQHGAAIVHGDYRLGNCLVDPSTGSIAAVLDWELCTLGDPLADVGYLGVYWGDASPYRGSANDPTSAPGFPTYDEVLARYVGLTGRDVSRIEYYRAFGAWRLAVIGEGVYARYLHGVMGDDAPDLAGMRDRVEKMAELALSFARRLG